MKFDELLILLPCHSLDDFPTHLKPAEAEGLLACWSAMWHPRLIASTGKIPGWRPAAALSDSLAEKLIVIPPSVESMVPSDLVERAQREGGRAVHGGEQRPATVAALLAEFDPVTAPSATIDPQLADDFLALGTCYLYGELLARRMRYGSTIDAERFHEHLLAAANAAVAGNNDEAHAALGLTFNVLVEARGKYYPVDTCLIDLTLVAGTTLGASLRQELAGPQPVNLLICGSVVAEMARREPESLAALRAALARGTVTLVGGELDEAQLPLIPPESILLQIRLGLAEYEKYLGQRPTVFGRRRYGLTPILPQILRQFGFRGAIHFTLDDGRFPQGDGAKTCWEGLAGTSIDAMARVPVDANQPANFTGLAEKVGHAMDHDHVATIGFAHWPAAVSPYYDDLRRATSYAPVLGKFVTLEHYFTNTEAPGMFSRFTPDQYRAPYLQQTVHAGERDPISRWVRYLTACRTANVCQTLGTLTGLLRRVDPDMGSLAAEVQRMHNSGDKAGDAAAESALEAQLADRSANETARLAAVIPREAKPAVTGYLVLNPANYRRRLLIETPALGALPVETAPILAAEESGGVKRVLVEVPSAGFAWVAAAEGTPGKHWSGEPLASSHLLRNEHCEVAIHPVTGAIQSIHDYRNRANRLSQQLVFRRPAPHDDPAAKTAGDEIADCRMVADEIEVTSGGRLWGEITSRGKLLDSAGNRLAGFIQRTQMTLASRVVTVDLELDPAAELVDDPWNSYFGCRFAWADSGATLHRDLHMASQSTTAKRLEAPRFVEIESTQGRTALLFGGLPYHSRVGQRMLDTLLLVRGETTRRFRLGIGVDVPHPWMAALDAMTRPTIHQETAAAPAPSPHGWLFHSDARNVIATFIEPLLVGPDETSPAPQAAEASTAAAPARAVGFRIRLWEVEGRAGRVKLRCFREPASARRTDFEHRATGDLPVEGDSIFVDMCAFDYVELEAYWKS
jgi:alpha-mannosidase